MRQTTALANRGFTLIEVMLVLFIVGLVTALATLALPDGNERVLARDAERLAAVLDAARAQARATGLPVRWRTTPDGFAFDGLPPNAPALPTHWLNPGVVAVAPAPILLGPDPIITPQAIELRLAGDPAARAHVRTDGLGPFTVDTR